MKKLEDILFITQARLNSERLPQKAVRPFAGTNITRICLDRFLRSSMIPDSQIYLSAREEELVALGSRMGVKIFNRSEESITDEGITIAKIYEWFDQLPFKYYVMVNACCTLLTVETLEEFTHRFMESSSRGMFGVVPRKTYYWDASGKMLNDWPAGKLLDTKVVEPIYEAAHCLYAGTMSDIGEGIHMGTFASKGDPELYVMKNELEAFDIDWPWQFVVAEMLYHRSKCSRVVTPCHND